MMMTFVSHFGRWFVVSPIDCFVFVRSFFFLKIFSFYHDQKALRKSYFFLKCWLEKFWFCYFFSLKWLGTRMLEESEQKVKIKLLYLDLFTFFCFCVSLRFCSKRGAKETQETKKWVGFQFIFLYNFSCVSKKTVKSPNFFNL